MSISLKEWRFAALKDDGSVVTWGTGMGEQLSNRHLQSGVIEIFLMLRLCAIKDDGSVVSWGIPGMGVNRFEAVAVKVVAIRAFAAIMEDGSVRLGHMKGKHSIWCSDQLTKDVVDIVGNEKLCCH